MALGAPSSWIGERVIVEVQGRCYGTVLRDGGRRPNRDNVQVIPVSMHPHEACEEVEALLRKFLALREGSPIGSKSRSDFLVVVLERCFLNEGLAGFAI